jgi:hypothetical protein
MKPSNTPHLPIPPVPQWEVVPVLEPADAEEPIPVLEPVEPDVLPVLESALPAGTLPGRSPRPLPSATVPILTEAPAPAGWINRYLDPFMETSLGLVGLPLGLAILASLPLLNFIALGYLLEAGARIARSGKLRDGVFGIRRAGRVGGLFAGIFLSLLPVWGIASMARSAELIDPTSAVTRNWHTARVIATIVTFIHIALACLWGGKLRHFLLPLLHPVFAVLTFVRCNPITRARDGVWLFFVEARFWYFFSLGLRGAAGAFVWLVLPVTCLAVGWKFPALGFVGFLLLLPVLVFLPFLQMNFARLNRLATMFDVVAVVRIYGRAPWSYTFALFVTLLFALPLYLLKIELVPRDALFLPAVLFIAFIWPARLLTGWVVAYAWRRKSLSHPFFLVTGLLPVPFLVLLYGLFVWLSQYLSWYGVGSLYEQHPFLLPVPFTGL